MLKDRDTLRKQYLRVVRDTKPNHITRSLGSWKYGLGMILLLALYGYCFDLTVTNRLYELSEIRQEDFYVQNSNETQKYFVKEALVRSFDEMHRHMESIHIVEGVIPSITNFKARKSRVEE